MLYSGFRTGSRDVVENIASSDESAINDIETDKDNSDPDMAEASASIVSPPSDEFVSVKPLDEKLSIKDRPILDLTREEFYALMNEAFGVDIKPP